MMQRGESSRSNSSSFPHCSFCLVAEFDIDKGSTLSHQYPANIGHDEHMLAELMLPDGVHQRAEDWTIFFLPAYSNDEKQQGQRQQNEPSAHQQSDRKTSISSSASTKGKEKSRDDLFYVINLVRTKHDNSVRRGALVKSIAIGTKHPFIHIFKPALLLALDDYFRTPSIDVLIRLFDSLNSLDLSAMPVFTREEKLILRATERRDFFEERFKDALPPRAASGLRNMTTLSLDEEDEAHPNTRSRSGSASTTQSSIAEEANNRAPSGLGRTTPKLPHRPSLASLRPGSSGSGLLRRRPSAAAQLQLLQSQHSLNGGVDGSHSSLSASLYSKKGGNSPMPMPGHGKVKDTHYWETSIAYGKLSDLPIRIPTDVFCEEIGEYSLITLISTFSTSVPTGPQHPHLHTNGSQTPPLIILFNAIVTGKRIVFLGHNQAASKVALHVLSACALGSGCGSGWRGVAKRCFPYANLGTMDELETVSGYIAGVTNPRFEELHAWDLLFNIENGKITIAKGIDFTSPTRTNTMSTKSGMTESNSSGSLTSSTGVGAYPEARLARTPSEVEASTSNTATSSSSFNTPSSTKTRDRAGTVLEARSDAKEVLFMEEVYIAISARYGERYIRAKFQEYAQYFIRQVIRHEEYFYGRTSIALQSQQYSPGQLGSGLVFNEKDLDLKEVQSNASRIEAFRATDSYQLYRYDELLREKSRAVSTFDLAYQIARLQKSKRVPVGECELIFATIAREVRSSEQIIEVSSTLFFVLD